MAGNERAAAGVSGDAPAPWFVVTVFCLGAAGIAFAPIFVRTALPAPPVVTGFYRMLFALPVLALLAARAGADRSDARGLWLATLSGGFFGADLALWHLAVTQTSVANATLLVNTTPIPVGLWSLLVLRERPGGRFVVGALFALAGAAVLLGTDLRAGVGAGGGLLALAAAVFYAGYLILMKGVRRGVGAAPATFAATCGALVVIGAFASLRGDPFTGFPAEAWWSFLGAAWISHVCGVLGIAWGLRWLRATFASVALFVQPLGAALLGWLLLAEPVSALQAIGGAAVLLGIFVASREAMDPHAGPREMG